MIVRELINKIGFKVDESQLRKANASVNRFKNNLRNFSLQSTLFLTAPFIGMNIWLGKTLSNFEQLDVAFETMLGSAEEADQLIRDMLDFAAKTPFEISEIGNVVKQLLAVGIESENVISTLKSLGDVAAGLSVPVSRLALNFGQIKTQGKLTGRELRDFAMAGVPLLEVLASQLGKTREEITEMVSKGEINFDAVNEAFKSMSSEGGRFANLMIKQASTLGGMWSNFKDLITLTARDFSKELLPMFKGIVLFLIKIVSLFKSLSPEMKKTLYVMGALLSIIGPLTFAFFLLIKVGLGVKAMLIAVTGASKLMSIATLLAFGKIALIGIGLIASLSVALILFEDIFRFMNDQSSLLGVLIDKLKKWNEALKVSGIDFIDTFKETFKSINDMVDSFIETMVGTFTLRWQFALDGLKNTFLSYFKSIANFVFSLMQPIFDLQHKLGLGAKINIKDEAYKGLGSIQKGFQKSNQMIADRSIIDRSAIIAGVPKPIGRLNQFTVSPNINITMSGPIGHGDVKQFTNDISNEIDRAMQRATRDLINAMPEDE